MKWITEWVNAEDANDRLTELASTNWYVSQIHPLPARFPAAPGAGPVPLPGLPLDGDRVFIAACQREAKKKKVKA